MTVLLQEGEFTLISTEDEAQPVTLHVFKTMRQQSPVIGAIRLSEAGYVNIIHSRDKEQDFTKLGIYSDLNTAIARLWGQRETALASYEIAQGAINER